jgi:hypothetical protein
LTVVELLEEETERMLDDEEVGVAEDVIGETTVLLVRTEVLEDEVVATLLEEELVIADEELDETLAEVVMMKLEDVETTIEEEEE